MYQDPITLQNRRGRDSVTQQEAEEIFSQIPNNEPGSITEELQSDTHSRQEYVNAPTKVTHILADPPTANDDISKSCDDSIIRHDTEAAATTDLNNPADQTGELNQDATFSREGKYNIILNPNTSF